jgi:glycosyltransferase involved in cell wall biosynthesis
VPRRILHISTRLILGGSQENTVLSCEGQSALGHDVHLAFGPIYGPEGSLLDRVTHYRSPHKSTITTHTVPHLVREVRPAADLACTHELIALIRTLRPDIVHTHSSKAGILGRIAAWHAFPSHSPHTPNPPGIVHTIHGPPFMPIDGGPFNQLKRRINNTIYTIAETHAAEHCHAIVSVADAMTHQFLTRGIGHPSLYTTVYSGMEVVRFTHPQPGQERITIRASLGLTDQDFVVGTVARLAEHKGHDDLLDALAPDMRANPHLKLLWVGDGWWHDRLFARIASLGLTDRIILTGLVPPDRVPGLMRAMDILAHPSSREGLPRTVPQALLAGTCPVAYDVDGTGEVCRDGETGRLIAFGDIDGLRAAILDLMQHPDTRQRMVERGRAWCLERFSVERMVSDLELVYERALRAARS